VVSLGVAVASCSSDDDVVIGIEGPGTEVEEDASAGDAGPGDASQPVDAAPPEDAAKPDTTPLPVVCASTPCATSLDTTFGEGFCVLLSDGTVACWGENADGQLGRGAAAGSVDSGNAERVLDVTDAVALDHTCARDKEGSIWCWGTGPFLRSTTRSTTKEATPVKLAIGPATAVAIAKRGTTTVTGTGCAVVEGGVTCWGSNVHGQITIPDLAASATATSPATPIVLPEGAPIRDLVVGNATFVVREDGSVVSWGAAPPIGRVSSLSPDPHPRSMALAGVSTLTVSTDNACAVVDGIVHCWGTPLLEGSHPRDRALPEPVPLPEPITRVATTSADSSSRDRPRGCATSITGAVYCWGNNANGQAGDGTKDHATKPVKVSLPGPAADVRTTPRATCALLTSGKVHCWGDDARGQLGGGTLKNPSALPKEVLLP